MPTEAVVALHPDARGSTEDSWLSASLDHAIWFHRSFRVDEWLLYDVESPNASGARGLVRGRFFDRNGRLVASAIQEGLIRHRAATAAPSAPGPAGRIMRKD
jgi:acyl-CoA thioesterase-2